MLRQLTVSNFALIENAKIDWANGFTVITGETGSGKSILLGALQLILGERADYSVIREESKKTIVEATFAISKDVFQSYFEQNDLDFEKHTIIRREINKNGKSRAFVNDTPVSLTQLKQLTNRLINIHSQYQTLALRDQAYQLSVLDAMAENETLLIELEHLYSVKSEVKKKIEEKIELKNKLTFELEFNQFQLEEMETLNLYKENFDEIQKLVTKGTQSEEIKAAYGLIVDTLNNEGGAIDLLYQIGRNIRVKDSQIEEFIQRINTSIIELRDVSDSAENELSDFSVDEELLNVSLTKLDRFNTILQKHHLTYQEELIELYEKLSEQVEGTHKIEEEIALLEETLKNLEIKGNELSDVLSSKRKMIAKNVELEVANQLNELKMEGANISFIFKDKGEWQSNGKDNLTLFFAPNKGIQPMPIEKSASGGELSRLMLVFQYLLSQKKSLPTIIFDEIDTGVSGVVAQRVGELLRKMGKTMQLIAITHLPQVASKGEQHILVKKEEILGQTKTSLTILGENERITEIASLMSGNKVNEAALLNAKNLMNE